jgi:hypothetical protein
MGWKGEAMHPGKRQGKLKQSTFKNGQHRQRKIIGTFPKEQQIEQTARINK